MSAPTDTDYPTSLDDTTSLPNPTAADTTKGVPHAELHTVQNKAIIAIQTKIGTGSSTPTANKVLMGSGIGTSSWSDAIPEASIDGLTTDLAAKANTSDLAAVATSGSYSDLSDTDATTADLTKLHDVTASATELNILDGATLSTTELNYVDGVTSAIQTQLDGKAAALGSDDNYVTDAEKIVIGNTSGTNTGDQTTITGNAGSATKLATARTIAGVSFDGSANISIGIDGLSDVDTSTTAPTDTQVLTWNNTDSKWEPADATGGSGSGGANLSTTQTSTTVTVASDSGTDAVLASASSTNAGILTSADWDTIQAALTLTGTQAPTNKDLSDSSNTFPILNQDTTGSAATLTTARTVQTNLASTSSSSFDGSANITPGVTGTLATSHGGTGATSQAAAYAALFPWSVITTTTQTAVVNHGYISNDASLVTITLPTTYAVGSVIQIVGMGAGGWKIALPSGDTIQFGNVTSSAGTTGNLASTNQYDTVELVAIVANTTWAVVGSVGNITVT